MRFAALANRDYALFWSSHVVSRIGSEMRMIALTWHVYQLTHSKLSLGLIGACRCVPVLVFGLWGGVTADRFDRRRVLLATQAFMAVVSTTLFFLTRAGLVTSLVIYAAVALIATTAAFENPARSSFVVNILPKEHLENGLALSVLGWQAATVVGPALGGLLLAATSIPTLYAADAVSFVPLVGILFVLRAQSAQVLVNEVAAKGASAGEENDAKSPVEEKDAKEGSGRKDVNEAIYAPPKSPAPTGPGAAKASALTGIAAIADALRFLRTKPVLIHLMWIDFLATLFAGSLLLLPVFSEEVFHRGAHGLGWLMAAPAVGAVMASMWISSRRPIRRHGPALLGAVAAYGVATALFGLTSSFWLALALLAAAGAADTVSTVVRQVARQTMTPDSMRGRLSAIHMLFFVSGPQLGELEAGALAEVTNVRVSVVTGGVLCIALAVLVWAIAPGIRELKVEAPAG